jgi:hypothetical protein
MSINFRNPKPARLRWQKELYTKIPSAPKSPLSQAGRQAVIVFTDTKKVIAIEEGNYTKTHRSNF